MNRSRFRGNRGDRNAAQPKPAADVDENNPIVKSFRQYAAELNDKHDRYERIVKQSRDITIESKRLIFLLHTIDARKPTAPKTLDEAVGRLTALCTGNFAAIARELAGLDPYQYARAYSAGLQEFVEAFTFYDYLSGGRIMDWRVLQQRLTFSADAGAVATAAAAKAADLNEGAVAEAAGPKDSGGAATIVCLVQPMEFMLGLADLGGEIMRKCINSLGAGDIQACHETCGFLQKMFSGYLSLTSSRNRDMSRKFYTMHQSVLKAEKVCYNVKVRGSEAAKWSANDAADKDRDDHDDEGFAAY